MDLWQLLGTTRYRYIYIYIAASACSTTYERSIVLVLSPLTDQMKC